MLPPVSHESLDYSLVKRLAREKTWSKGEGRTFDELVDFLTQFQSMLDRGNHRNDQ